VTKAEGVIFFVYLGLKQTKASVESIRGVEVLVTCGGESVVAIT
jgi:hypothetical protein